MKTLAPHVASLAEYYTQRIIFRANQHGMALGDEATAALFASLACLHSACADDVEELRQIVTMALDAVITTSDANNASASHD